MNKGPRGLMTEFPTVEYSNLIRATIDTGPVRADAYCQRFVMSSSFNDGIYQIIWPIDLLKLYCTHRLAETSYHRNMEDKFKAVKFIANMVCSTTTKPTFVSVNESRQTRPKTIAATG